MPRKNKPDRAMRRMYGHLMCKIVVGDPDWFSTHGIFVNLVVFLMLTLFLLNGCTARGDLIVEVQTCDATITPDTGWFVAEVGADLAGPGSPLGWLAFSQTAENGGLALMASGSFSDRYGTDAGEQTLRVQTSHHNGWDQAVILPHGSPVGQGYSYSDFLRVYDSETDIPENNPLYIPFVWQSWLNRDETGVFQTVYQGVGYVSVDQIDPMPIAGLGSKPSYRVHQIVLTSGDLTAGGLPGSAAVPEPSTIIAGIAVVAVVVAQILLTRRMRRCSIK